MGLFSWIFTPLIDRRVADFQMDLISKHCAEVENIYRQMRGWRHDYHNHIQFMKACLALGKIDDLSGYLGKLDEDLTAVDTIVKTGNIMADAILNSKLSLAKTKKININAKACVPKRIPVSDVDLCIMLGNLLDNATEACMKLEDPADRFIRVYLDILKKQLYISVTNSAGGEIRRLGKSYLTTKGENHGLGLLRIDKIAAKYNGYVNRQNEEGVFATEIMLPL